MSEVKYVVGKQYRVADASKCGELSEVLDAGILTLPEVFTVSHVDEDGDAYSLTEGCLWKGTSTADSFNPHGWMVASKCSLEEGAFEEVITEKSS